MKRFNPLFFPEFAQYTILPPCTAWGEIMPVRYVTSAKLVLDICHLEGLETHLPVAI